MNKHLQRIVLKIQISSAQREIRSLVKERRAIDAYRADLERQYTRAYEHARNLTRALERLDDNFT